MASVVVRSVGLEFIGTENPTEGVGGPKVEPIDVVAKTDIETVGFAFLDEEIGEIVFGFFVYSTDKVGGVAWVEHFIAVCIEQLRKVFKINFRISGKMIGEIVFGTKNDVLRFLNVVLYFVTLESARNIEVVGSSEGSIEEVDDIVVRACIKEYLAVKTSGHFDAELVGNIVLGRNARLQASRIESVVIDIANAWVDKPIASGNLVGYVSGQAVGVFMLFYVQTIGVVEEVVGRVAFDCDTVTHPIGADKVGDVQSHVKSVNATMVVVVRGVSKAHVVVGIGYVSLENGTGSSDEHKVGS